MPLPLAPPLLLVAMGCAGGGETEVPSDVDVLVIGAGGAGLAAAVEASRAGATVAVVEREEAPSDVLAMQWMFSGSPEQADNGIVDGPEELLAEWASFTGGDASDPWVTRFAEENVVSVRDWLVEMGATFELDGCDTCEAVGSVPRLHRAHIPTALLMAQLPEDALHTATTATALDTDDDGAVIGAWVVDGETGEERLIEAEATIVATGGFARNLEEVRAWRPELVDVDLWLGGQVWADGGGAAMVRAVGGALENPGATALMAESYPDPVSGAGARDTTVTQGVWVNAAGERFQDESAVLSYAAAEAVAAQPGGVAWVILDADLQAQIEVEDERRAYDLRYEDLAAAGYAFGADTLGELAVAAGIDPAGLTASVDAYNAAGAAGEPDAWRPEGRLRMPIAVAPYYAVRLAVTPARSFGGVDVDESGRVLDERGAVVPGLYAAGEVTGMAGGSLVGEGGGPAFWFNGSISAVVLSGRIAGATAAAE